MYFDEKTLILLHFKKKIKYKILIYIEIHIFSSAKAV